MQLNRYVLRSFLKLSKVSLDLISLGIWFQRVGPDMLNDLSANVLYLVLGITSKSESLLGLRLFPSGLCF